MITEKPLSELVDAVRDGIYTIGMQHLEDEALAALNEIVRRLEEQQQ